MEVSQPDMHGACDMVECMGNVQIRNVPTELHRRVKSRAAEEGLSLSDYLLRIVEREASIPTPDEIVQRLRALPPLELDEPPSVIIRRMRDAS